MPLLIIPLIYVSNRGAIRAILLAKSIGTAGHMPAYRFLLHMAAASQSRI